MSDFMVDQESEPEGFWDYDGAEEDEASFEAAGVQEFPDPDCDYEPPFVPEWTDAEILNIRREEEEDAPSRDPDDEADSHLLLPPETLGGSA